MDTMEAIYTRRSIRKFLQTPVEFDKVMEVVKAGSYAPCSGNQQNWKFIVEVNHEKIKSLYPYALEQECFLTATVAIVVVAETEKEEEFYGMRGKRLYAIQNCAAATQNILLAAHALGLGAVWIGAFDENKLNEMYGVPGSARVQSIVLMGYPDEQPNERKMKDLWYLVNFDKYGNKYQHPHRITHDMSAEWAMQGKKLQDAVERKKTETQEPGVKEQAQQAMEQTKEKAKSFLNSLKKDPPKNVRK